MGKLLSSLLLTAALAWTAPVTYTTLSSWQAAGPQDGTQGFESKADVTQMAYPSFVLNSILYTGVGGNLYVYPNGYTWTDLGSGPTLTSADTGYIRIDLPANIYGVGFLIGSSAGIAVNVVINGDTPLTIANPTNPPPNVGNLGQFWGVRSDVAISSLTIAASQNGYRAIIDNFTWGGQATQQGGGGGGAGPTETPEVSSGLLIGGALVLVPLLRRAVQRS